MLACFLFNIDFTKTKFICLNGDFVLLAEFSWLGREKFHQVPRATPNIPCG